VFVPGDGSFAVSEFADRRFFQLTYGDGTRFLMDRGATRIWGEPGTGLCHDDLCVYLLGPVMGFVLRQRGNTTLHASALSFRGRAMALVGEAGAGKSTTAAALALRGWPVLCEDVCALELIFGKYQVLPAYPRVCLWPDSVDFLFSGRAALPLIVRGWEKRFLALDGTRAEFASTCSPLAASFFLLHARTKKPRRVSNPSHSAKLCFNWRRIPTWTGISTAGSAPPNSTRSLGLSVLLSASD